MIRKTGSINCQKEGIPNWNDERIITNAMQRAQDQERIAELEGLLRDIINDRSSPYDISDEMYVRIESALNASQTERN